MRQHGELPPDVVVPGGQRDADRSLWAAAKSRRQLTPCCGAGAYAFDMDDGVGCAYRCLHCMDVGWVCENHPIIEALTKFIDRPKREGFAGDELVDSMGLRSPALHAQAALLGAVLLVAAGAVWFEHDRSVATEARRLEALGMEQARANAIARQQAAELARHLQPLPISGLLGGDPDTDLPPLKVSTSPDQNVYVKVEEWSSRLPAATVFVRSGEAVEVGVPRGTYRVKLAYGKAWYGEAIRFGPLTSYSVVPDPLTFSIEGHRLAGHELNLNRVRNGNLRPKTIDANEF